MRSAQLIRLGAEALGTLLLVYLGAGAILTGAAGFFGGAIGFSLALAVAIWLFGPVSGGHFNPSVTLAMALRNRLGWVDAASYVAAQIVGGFIGALLLWATYGQQGVNGLLGATRIAEDAGSGRLVGALLAEAIATFVLVCVVLVLTGGDRAGRRSTALGIGFTLGLGMLAIGAVTGGSMNFARTFGPELTLAMAGGDTAWGQIWVYLIGPAIGAAAAAFGYDTITRPALPATEPRITEPRAGEHRSTDPRTTESR